MAKLIGGLVLMAIGVALGLYVGVWLCFVGGIVDVITEIRADEISAIGIAVGIAKVVFSGLAGYVSAAVCILPGYVMVKAA